MQDVIRAYLEYLEGERNYSPLTVRSYAEDLTQFTDFLRRHRHQSFSAVRNNILRDYLRSMVERGLSTKSISRKLASLRSFFKYLRRHNLVDANPTLTTIERCAEALGKSVRIELL